MLQKYAVVIFVMCLLLTNGKNRKIAVTRRPPDPLQDQDISTGYDFSEEEMNKFKIWPRSNVPYFIDDFSFDKVLRDRIRNYLDEVGVITGLQFIELPRPPEDGTTRWVLFINRRGMLQCEDYTVTSFTNTGVQRVVVGYDCLSTNNGTLAPTVLALAGVPPQHNAPNRNQHIEILTDNIIPDKRKLFEAVSDKDWLFHDFPYDFKSAGHYNSYKYTVNGFATIKPKIFQQSIDNSLGEAEELSSMDIRKIKLIYSYIKQKNENRFPECSKLFRPGANFNRYKPESKNLEIKPLNKPTKYLGLDEHKKSSLATNEDNQQNNRAILEKDKIMLDGKSLGTADINDMKVNLNINESKVEDKSKSQGGYIDYIKKENVNNTKDKISANKDKNLSEHKGYEISKNVDGVKQVVFLNDENYIKRNKRPKILKLKHRLIAKKQSYNLNYKSDYRTDERK